MTRISPASATGVFKPFELADVLAVHVHVHEPPQLAALVEEEIRHRQLAQRVLHGRGLDLELALPARLRREQRRQSDYDHAASTDKTGGSWRAISVQLSPPSVDANTEPLCVPK